MPEHEPKRCPRCGSGFECRQGSIHRCQCVDVVLSDEVRESIAHTYDDCLCRDCLMVLADRPSSSSPAGLLPSQRIRERRQRARDAARARSVTPEEILATLNGLSQRQ